MKKKLLVRLTLPPTCKILQLTKREKFTILFSNTDLIYFQILAIFLMFNQIIIIQYSQRFNGVTVTVAPPLNRCEYCNTTQNKISIEILFWVVLFLIILFWLKDTNTKVLRILFNLHTPSMVLNAVILNWRSFFSAGAVSVQIFVTVQRYRLHMAFF